MYSFLCLYSTRKYLIIRNLFRFNLEKRRCVSPESNTGQSTGTPSWITALLSVSCECICTELTSTNGIQELVRQKGVWESCFVGTRMSHSFICPVPPHPQPVYIHHWKGTNTFSPSTKHSLNKVEQIWKISSKPITSTVTRGRGQNLGPKAKE